MRRFHLTQNALWRPIINVDKLWTLVSDEDKATIAKSKDLVPVIDTLQHGYGKVLGNGQWVSFLFSLLSRYYLCGGSGLASVLEEPFNL